MTREEAIYRLKNMAWLYGSAEREQNIEAIDMAIEALSADAVSDAYKRGFEDCKRAYEIELARSADRELANLKSEYESADAVHIETYRELYEKYVELKHASVNAVQGEWIEKYNGNGWNDFWDYTCSNCGKKYERADAVLYHANFCPNCGADMRKKEDE